MREVRISVVIPLPADEEEELAKRVEAFKVKAAIVALLETHHLTGQVTHETVTPRGPNVNKVVPGAPASQSGPDVATDPAPVHPDKPHAEGRQTTRLHGVDAGKAA
jgi:hypothetical protein